MDEPKDPPSLAALDARLRQAQERERRGREGSDTARTSALGQAMKVGINWSRGSPSEVSSVTCWIIGSAPSRG